MRKSIDDAIGKDTRVEHVGLVYDVLAPYKLNDEKSETGKIPTANDVRDGFLDRLEKASVPSDYVKAFDAWRKSLDDGRTIVLELTTASRLFIGHGNPAPTEVGLTVHHTWGAPIIPGSALKGLLNHYIDETYGPERDSSERSRNPIETSRQTIREDVSHPSHYQGVTWSGNQIQHGPGLIHRKLFGSPAADSDDKPESKHDDPDLAAGMRRGGLVYHDAWYAPGSCPDNKPYVRDVLTPHQASYYKDAGQKAWPNDYDNPIPVGFINVRPGASFLVAVTPLDGDVDWAEFAVERLIDALCEWGIGGKTAAGYGRFEQKKCRLALSNWRERRQKEKAERERQSELASLTPSKKALRIILENHKDPGLRNWKGVHQLLFSENRTKVIEALGDFDWNEPTFLREVAEELKKLMVTDQDWLESLPTGKVSDAKRRLHEKTLQVRRLLDSGT